MAESGEELQSAEFSLIFLPIPCLCMQESFLLSRRLSPSLLSGRESDQVSEWTKDIPGSMRVGEDGKMGAR